jgi:hypothetical protein
MPTFSSSISWFALILYILLSDHIDIMQINRVQTKELLRKPLHVERYGMLQPRPLDPTVMMLLHRTYPFLERRILKLLKTIQIPFQSLKSQTTKKMAQVLTQGLVVMYQTQKPHRRPLDPLQLPPQLRLSYTRAKRPSSHPLQPCRQNHHDQGSHRF